MGITIVDKTGKELPPSDIQSLGVNLTSNVWSVTLADGSVVKFRVNGDLLLTEDPLAK